VLLIAANPRVASTWFDLVLTATERVGIPLEYMLHHELMTSAAGSDRPRLTVRGRAQRLRARAAGRRSWELVGELDPASVREHLVDLAARRTSASGVFSSKVHAFQMIQVIERYGVTPDLWGVPVRWTRLRRRDRLAQAVSLTIARQTQRWAPGVESTRTTSWDPDRIVHALESIEQWEAWWDEFLARRDDPVLELWSEDIVVDPLPGVRATLAMLGDHTPVTDAGIGAADGRSPDADLRAEWTERLLAERPELADRRWAP
jgi:LPS sulfotransferase NodH